MSKPYKFSKVDGLVGFLNALEVRFPNSKAFDDVQRAQRYTVSLDLTQREISIIRNALGGASLRALESLDKQAAVTPIGRETSPLILEAGLKVRTIKQVAEVYHEAYKLVRDGKVDLPKGGIPAREFFKPYSEEEALKLFEATFPGGLDPAN